MSIIASIDPESVEREKRRKADALSESLKMISEAFSLTTDELIELLQKGIDQKKLARTQREVDAMKTNGVTKF